MSKLKVTQLPPRIYIFIVVVVFLGNKWVYSCFAAVVLSSCVKNNSTFFLKKRKNRGRSGSWECDSVSEGSRRLCGNLRRYFLQMGSSLHNVSQSGDGAQGFIFSFLNGKEMFLFGWYWGSWSRKSHVALKREIICWTRTPELLSDQEPKKADTIQLIFKMVSLTAAAPFLCAFYTSSISPGVKPEGVTDPAHQFFYILQSSGSSSWKQFTSKQTEVGGFVEN